MSLREKFLQVFMSNIMTEKRMKSIWEDNINLIGLNSKQNVCFQISRF